MTTAKHNQLLPHLFRQEFAKMTAVLCRHFGLLHLEAAEDIASDTFLKASEYWAVHGIPDNPEGWLYAVAKNKTKDYLKRRKNYSDKVSNEAGRESIQQEDAFEFSSQSISDSQLAMIFAVCSPENPPGSQIALALQILCGFSVGEIADAFLSKAETIKKRLLRGREKLRNENFRLTGLSPEEVDSRMESVLKTIYLLFNEGYFSRSNDQAIRKELCAEALRLALLLTENPLTNRPQANALLALLCFQSSRFEARTDGKGGMILFEEQDLELWNKELIKQGNYYLVNACVGNEVSKYHLEACIAYWHTVKGTTNKWEHILGLYDRLLLVDYSPVAALNRVFAYAKVHGYHKGIHETEKLHLKDSSSYHSLLGHLYSENDAAKAVWHYKAALNLTRSKAEKETLQKEIGKLGVQE